MSSTGKQPSQQPERNAGRCFVKCDYCRQRHKKCLPASRIWPEGRCTACEEAELPCGPSLHWKSSSLSSLERPAVKRARTPSCSAGQTGSGLLLPPACLEQPQQFHAANKQTQFQPESSLSRNSCSSPSTTLLSSYSSSIKINSFDAKGPLNSPVERKPGDSTQDGLGPRLIHLGFLCILYEYWKGLEAASNPSLHTETGNIISNNIRYLTRCTAREVQCALKTIIALIEAEGRSTESQNLRYREALDTVDDINKLGYRSEVFVELEVIILNKLIIIYEQQEDAPTVRRFSLRRSKLHHGSSTTPLPCHIVHTAQCWAETCGKLPALLDSLDLQIEPPLYANGNPLFPAQQSALRCGHDDIANVLCSSDGALQSLDMLKQNPMLAAAAVGKLPLFDTHIGDDKSLLKSRDLFQRTVLFHTAHRGTVETFMTLVQAGADVSDRDEAGQSVLGAASAAGNIDVVRWLLEVGEIPSPNDHFFGPRSPLHDAARAGHTGVCSLLLENGAYVDYLVDNMAPAQAARVNGFNNLADMLELSLANPANQHPVNRLFNAPRPQTEENDVPSLYVRQSNPYSCSTPLPFEVSYANLAPENKDTPNTYQNSQFASSPSRELVKSDGEPLDHPIHVYDSGRLFGD